MKTTIAIHMSKQAFNSLYKLTEALLVLVIILANSLALADDTAVYLDEASLPPEQTRPNVVLVLDSSGSMGLPVQDDDDLRELSRYNHSVDYSVQEDVNNISGGPGDSNYVYFYQWRDGDFARPFYYFAKAHRSQLDCNYSTLDDSTPYTMNDNTPNNYDTFIYNDGTADWGYFCGEYDSSCGFTAGATGPKVDCRSERASNVITSFSAYPPTDTTSRRRQNGLYMVNHNFHNFLQTYYRYSVLQKVVRDLVDVGYDINLSMMQFNGGDGGYVFQESVLATNTANQTIMKSAVSRMIFDDSTPLSETLWEASRYLRGESADLGNNSGTDTPSAAYISGTSTYNSPIDYACQKSHIIVLTDGEPTSDTDRDSSIETRMGYNCSGNCLDDYADWLRKDNGDGTYTGYTRGSTTEGDDQRRDHIATSTLPDKQTIQVHTIGFATNDDADALLASASTGSTSVDDGLYATADSSAQLADVFDNFFEFVEFESDTSVAPAVAVNAYSGLQHREELYFALFKPTATPRWNGNIKKYKLMEGVIVDASENPNNPAINSDTGYFRHNSRSFWWPATVDLDNDGLAGTADEPDEPSYDGDDTTIGGVATQLTTPTQRNVYTYTGSAPVYSSGAPTPRILTAEHLDLNSSNTKPDNTAIAATPTLLGPTVTTTTYAQEIIDWARGGSTDTAPNYFFPDVIHNPPVVVTYETNNSCVTANPPPADSSVCFDDTLFAATNMGTFHAIDPTTGEEKWSFVPKELLTNLTAYYERAGGFTDKVYGLDGTMKVWRLDVDEDGTIESGDGDHVYLYQPMRRGGTHLYAFDLTNINSPRLMWQIVGTGLDTTPSGDYRDLAQTWSSPQRAKVNWCENTTVCGPRDVLIFGGGYDPVHDTATTPVSSSKGNAIYMVDATTSELLWSAGNGGHSFNNSQLTNSFAADITIGDVDGDDYLDLFYAVDIQGNVWRFDFDNDEDTTVSTSTVRGGLVAELGGTGINFRRFYNAPDIAFFSPRGQRPFLSISIASGFREDPRETDISDYLFVFFDRYPSTHPNSYTFANGSTIDFNDLGTAGTPTPYGWHFALTANGEKGLSRTVTFNSAILMTTYIPESTFTCEGSTGSGRFYMLNALDGTSVILDNTTDDPEDTLPYQQLEHGGIPPEPTLIFGSGPVCTSNCDNTDTSDDVTSTTTKITACVGTECLTNEIIYDLSRVYWRENQ